MQRLRENYLRPRDGRPPTTVQGVHHLALICRDVEETIQFYQEFLGFPLVELVENRDYAGSSHFFFDIGNRNLLGFFDFPGHDHPAFTETIGGVQHLAISISAEQYDAAKKKLDESGWTISGRTAASRRACTSATRTVWASSSTARNSASSTASRSSTRTDALTRVTSRWLPTANPGWSAAQAGSAAGARSRLDCGALDCLVELRRRGLYRPARQQQQGDHGDHRSSRPGTS